MGYVIVKKSQKIKKRKKLFKAFWLIFSLLIVVVIAVALYIYWHAMIPTIIEIAQTKVTAETVLVINQAVLSVLSQDCDYSTLIDIQRDANNNITLLSCNTIEMNNLARKTAVATQGEIENLSKHQISIPFGTISGMPLLVEKGPNVSITVAPIGNVQCDFSSTFTSVGINQTLHRVYINVRSKVDLIIPTSHHTVETLLPVLVCENIIVGKVPDTYLNGGLMMGGYDQ